MTYRSMWKTAASAWPPLAALGAVVLLSVGMLAVDLAVDSRTAGETDHLVENSLRSIALADDLRYQAYRLTTPNLTREHIQSIAEQIDQDAMVYGQMEFGGAERLEWNRLQGLLQHLRAEQPLSEADHTLVSDIGTTIAKLVAINQAEARANAIAIDTAHRGGIAMDIAVLVVTAFLVGLVAIALIRALRRQRSLLRVHLATLEERHHDLEAFASRASHDLKGPLSPIRGYAHMLTIDTDPQVQELARRISRNVDRMNSIIDDLLELSVHGKPVQGVAELEVVVAEVLAELSDGRVRCKVPKLKVACSPGLLGQVLRNLVTNASKYRSPDRPLEIDVEATTRDNAVEIIIRDNGIGMAATTVANAFEPHYRAAGTSASGHGLGLAIVKRTIGAIGGTVSLASELGVGSQVTVRVPAA